MKLIPAQFVRPFVKSNKNDFLDAEAMVRRLNFTVVWRILWAGFKEDHRYADSFGRD